MPAEVEPAVIVLRMDNELVALHGDHGTLEEFLRALAGDAWIGPGADGHVVRTGDFDLLEVADLIVA